MSEPALQCISDIHPDNEWHHDDDSGLRYADTSQERIVIVTIRDQTAFLEPPPGLQCSAVLHARCCSQVVGLGPSPPQHQATGQLPGLLPNSLLQNVKVALRVQPPPVTVAAGCWSRGVRRFSPELLTQKEKAKVKSTKLRSR